ncbi:DUF6278 family protein [Streptacidiphilus sp. EB129]|jgi:hypothetical protein|uniref:DUF6278 family protein n=1 Tax=Streptacidiphilus sp. EB129 TaxID=3156262 RepID=UPI003511B2D3
MGFAFLDRWRPRRDAATPLGATPPRYGAGADDPGSLGEMLSECGLLRERALDAGLALDDTVASLAALDQLPPTWRDDPETAEWLGNDAGLYLGTVIVRELHGSGWMLLPDGHPVVVLASGREVDVVAMGLSWARDGSPELSAAYAAIDAG